MTGSLEEHKPDTLGNGTTTPAVLGPSLRAQAENIAGPSGDDTGAGSGATENRSAEAGPTRAEKLASEIFRFVSGASSLVSSIESAASSKDAKAAYQNGNGYRSMQDETSTARPSQDTIDPTEMQLLRMRSKKHEIIIFPDPKFLCCVVTTTARPSH